MKRKVVLARLDEESATAVRRYARDLGVSVEQLVTILLAEALSNRLDAAAEVDA